MPKKRKVADRVDIFFHSAVGICRRSLVSDRAETSALSDQESISQQPSICTFDHSLRSSKRSVLVTNRSGVGGERNRLNLLGQADGARLGF
jgi:hypothetical protein